MLSRFLNLQLQYVINCGLHPYRVTTFQFTGRHELMLGSTFVADTELKPPNKEVPPQVDPSLDFSFSCV